MRGARGADGAHLGMRGHVPDLVDLFRSAAITCPSRTIPQPNGTSDGLDPASFAFAMARRIKTSSVGECVIRSYRPRRGQS